MAAGSRAFAKDSLWSTPRLLAPPKSSQHQRLYLSEAPLLAGTPLAPSDVAIDEQGSVEVHGRTIRSKVESFERY